MQGTVGLISGRETKTPCATGDPPKKRKLKKNVYKKNLFKQECEFVFKNSPPQPQRLGLGRGLGLTGRVSPPAHSPDVPRGQDHFPEGPGAPDPAAGRLLLRLQALQSEPGPAPAPGRSSACGSEA